jgi:hypothetical protein
MINLKSLISLLPSQYKENDTYKVDGKGILERFLDICGYYLADITLPDIESELELIDINNVPLIYLNYLWEFLGEIPFATGPSIDKSKFEKYYDGLKTKDELIALSKVWTLEKGGPVVLDEARVRAILKYAITLTKIRGSRKFFETLLGLYGFNCTIEDPVSNGYNAWVESDPLYDSEYYKADSAKFDEDPRCEQCITVDVDISSVVGYMSKDSAYFCDSKAIVFSTKYEGLLNLYEGLAAYEKTKGGTIELSSDQSTYISENEEAIFSDSLPASLSDFLTFRSMMETFFDRYLPINVKAHITYEGKEVDDGITINVTQDNPITIRQINPLETSDSDEYDQPIPNTLILPKLTKLIYTVSITSYWSGTDTRWQVSGDGGVNWGEPHDINDKLEIYVPGTYLVRDINGIVSQEIIVTLSTYMTWYSLEGFDNILENNPIIPNGSVINLEDYPNYYFELNLEGYKYIKLQEENTKARLIPYSKKEYIDPVIINGSYKAILSTHPLVYSFDSDCIDQYLGTQEIRFRLPNTNKYYWFILKGLIEYVNSNTVSYEIIKKEIFSTSRDSIKYTLKFVVNTNLSDGYKYLRVLPSFVDLYQGLESYTLYFWRQNIFSEYKFSVKFGIQKIIRSNDKTWNQRANRIRLDIDGIEVVDDYKSVGNYSDLHGSLVTSSNRRVSKKGTMIPIAYSLIGSDLSSLSEDDLGLDLYIDGIETEGIENAANNEDLTYYIEEEGTYKFVSRLDKNLYIELKMTYDGEVSDSTLDKYPIILDPESPSLEDDNTDTSTDNTDEVVEEDLNLYLYIRPQYTYNEDTQSMEYDQTMWVTKFTNAIKFIEIVIASGSAKFQLLFGNGTKFFDNTKIQIFNEAGELVTYYDPDDELQEGTQTYYTNSSEEPIIWLKEPGKYTFKVVDIPELPSEYKNITWYVKTPNLNIKES